MYKLHQNSANCFKIGLLSFVASIDYSNRTFRQSSYQLFIGLLSGKQSHTVVSVLYINIWYHHLYHYSWKIIRTVQPLPSNNIESWWGINRFVWICLRISRFQVNHTHLDSSWTEPWFNFGVSSWCLMYTRLWQNHYKFYPGITFSYRVYKKIYIIM